MTDKQKEALDAVNKINDELFKKYRHKSFVGPQLHITFSGDMVFIGLSGSTSGSMCLPEIGIYVSHEDDRIYYEKSDKYETFYKYIKRKFNLIKEEIYAIKI